MRFDSGCLADDRSPIRAGASGSVDPVDARGGLGLVSESKRAEGKRGDERNMFHFNYSREFAR